MSSSTGGMAPTDSEFLDADSPIDATHTYAAAGMYEATITVTDFDGETDTAD